LTAARQGELVKAKWRNVDLDEATWTIPPANRKLKKSVESSARDFVVPLSPLALALFRELKENARASDWVVPSPMHAGSAGFSLVTLSTACRNFFDRRDGKPAALKMPPFTPHDLRRTARSCFTEKLGADHFLAERCLGHAVGGRVTQTYDTGAYLEQRRALLDKWAVYVERLAKPEAAPVAFLPAPARPG
jgi:integrase